AHGTGAGMSTGRRGHMGRNGLLAPDEERGAGASCQTEPAPLSQTTTLPLEGGTGQRLLHSIPAPTHHGATRPLRVEYQQSRALSPDECRRRIQLAYGYVLGIVPWPDEHTVVPDPGPTTATPSLTATARSPERTTSS